MVTEMKKQQFDKVTDANWQAVAEESLRGLPFETLLTQTLEGIELKPLYTKEQIDKALGDRQDDMLKTIRSAKQSGGWVIAQRSYTTTGETFVEEVNEAIEKGNEAIVYNGLQQVNWEDKDLEALASLVTKYPVYALNVNEDDAFVKVFEKVASEERKNVQGFFTGNVTLPEGYHFVRTEGASTIEHHLNGADIVTELALTLAQAAEAAKNYNSFTQFENNFFAHFAVDTHFFLEIAKLRAFRLLWQSFAKGYGHEKDSRVPIYSETSLRTFSKLDPYVNLLRTGNEAFSAVLGGTDVLTVHPHDVVAKVTPAGIRHARNIQLIIKAETFVENIVDPAGGSYYIDILTNQFVEKAWEQFLAIEDAGGYEAYVSSGKLKEKLNELYQARLDLLNTRKHSLIGTNIYPDLENEIIEEETLSVPNRLATVFEALRIGYEREQPNVVLLTFGELKDFKARADFVTGFLATAGIRTNASPAFASVDEGKKWIEENDFDYGIICAHPRQTNDVVEQLIVDFPNNKWIDVAGKYDEETEKRWKEAGVSDFIYQGQNLLDKFEDIERRWKGDRANAKA